MIKHIKTVTRNGNTFAVGVSNCNHYYLSTMLGGARVTAWHRTPLTKIKEFYKEV